MKLDKRLNLVIPIDSDSGRIYAHSVPISREVFEANIFIISKTLSVLYEDGLTAFAGPRVAATMMKNIAIDRGIWEGPHGVENTLMNEIRRLTNVVIPGERGWTTIPFDDAVRSGAIDADAASEVEGQVVFFTCICWMHKPKEAHPLLQGVHEIWESQSTSLNSTEWANSLPTSMPEESSGVMATASSIPS
jgi:hypothetical protein